MSSAVTPQGFPLFPGWRFPPPNEDGSPGGEAQLFQRAEDVPAGWWSHPGGEAAQKRTSTYDSKTHTGDGLPKFPGWRYPPGATRGDQAELFKKYEDVPPGYTEALVTEADKDGDGVPDKAKKAKEAPKASPKAAKEAPKEPVKAPAPVALTRVEAIAKLVAEFGYKADDPDMALASDDAVLTVLKDEETKRGNAPANH